MTLCYRKSPARAWPGSWQAKAWHNAYWAHFSVAYQWRFYEQGLEQQSLAQEALESWRPAKPKMIRFRGRADHGATIRSSLGQGSQIGHVAVLPAQTLSE